MSDIKLDVKDMHQKISEIGLLSDNLSNVFNNIKPKDLDELIAIFSKLKIELEQLIADLEK